MVNYFYPDTTSKKQKGSKVENIFQ